MVAAALPLIGRDDVLARAERLLDTGSGGIVLVGEEGVGKSCIAREVLRLGAERGYATASTIGTQAAASIPLGALSHIIPAATNGNILAAAQKALAKRAADRRLMLAIDDAHLLDNHSAALVLQLAMGMPSFVVATIRTGEPVPDSVVALWKEGLTERVDVEPLDDRSIVAIAEQVLGGPTEPHVAQVVVDRADGVPLVARELCLAGLDSGAIARRDGRWSLVGELSPSPRLMELVGARVDGLDEDERQGLTVVAQGEPLSLRIANDLVPLDVQVGLERRGLLLLREDGRRRELWLSHPIYADVLRATTGPIKSASLKSALATATREAGMRRRSDLIRVATWQLEAGQGDPDLLLEAAHETYRARDMAGTARLAAGAWDIRLDPTAGYLLGTAIGFSGRHVEADAILSAATELATNDAEHTRLVLAHSSVLSAGLGMAEAAIDLLAAADTRVTDVDARATLRAQQAHLLAFRGEVDHSLALAEPILDHGSGAALVVAAMAAMIAYWLNGAYRAGVQLMGRVLPEHRTLWATGAVAIPPELLELQGHGARVAMGELDAVELLDDLASRRIHAANRPIAVLRAVHAAMAAILRGRPLEAEAIVTGAAPVTSDPLASTAEALIAVASALTGRGDQAAEGLARAEQAMRRENRTFNPVIDEARIWTWIAQGRPHDARRLASAAVNRAVRAHRWGMALGHIHDLARIGAPTEAMAQIARVGDRVDGPLARARRLHVLGIGRADVEALETASRIFEELGANLLAAEAAADAGRAARRRGNPRRATRSFQRAAAVSARCEGVRTPALSMPNELTPLSPREREVAALAASGLSSEDMADRLFLSVRTVDNHLQHVYQKLGIGSRAELSAAMRQRQA